jgi:DNA-directed RNA polymerase specialized sigma24 family protein
MGKELLAFALWWAERYRWRSGSPDILPKGHELRDLVQHVILQTISGERNWVPEKGELLPWLKDQVKSVVDALAKSAAHRREHFFSKGDQNGLTEQEEHLAMQVDGSENLDRLTPEEVLISKESDEERLNRTLYKYSALFYAIEGDAELEEVLEAVINGCELKPRFLAQELNVPVENIYNRLKRLRRKALTLKVE